MNIIFLGSMLPPDRMKYGSGISVAGNKMQYNIIKYLAQNEDVHLYVLSEMPVRPFPHDKRVFVKRYQDRLGKNVEYIEIPYINIPIIKQWSQICSYISCAKQWIDLQDKPVLLAMNLFPYNGLAFLKLKQKYGLKNAAILADLPIDDNYSRKGLSKTFRKIYNKITVRCIEQCNNYIVLNEQAIKNYTSGSVRYIVVDGGINPEEVTEATAVKSGEQRGSKKRIVYSGALTDYNGIRELIAAMKYISDDSIALEIYGGGILENEVVETIKGYDNISFRGKVSNEDMMKIQSEAWLLVNPRPVDDPIARVTFPSKIFEYMVSGTPVLTTRLNGFTEEYYDKMFFVEDNDPKAMAQKISEIASMDKEELNRMSIKAKEFVIKEKSWEKQTDKIYRFLEEL